MNLRGDIVDFSGVEDLDDLALLRREPIVSSCIGNLLDDLQDLRRIEGAAKLVKGGAYVYLLPYLLAERCGEFEVLVRELVGMEVRKVPDKSALMIWKCSLSWYNVQQRAFFIKTPR